MSAQAKTMLALASLAVAAVGVGTVALLVDSPDAGTVGCTEMSALCSVEAKEMGGVRYVTVDAPVLLCDAGVVLDRRVFGESGFELVGEISDACRVRACAGKCGPAPILAAAHPCACARPDAGPCVGNLLDGGQWPVGVTIPPGRWSGPGCLPKPCGPERAGRQGASWPKECPER